MSESEQLLATNVGDYVVEEHNVSSQPQDEGEGFTASSPIDVDDESSAQDDDEFSEDEESSNAMMEIEANTSSFIHKVQLARKRRSTALPVIPLPAKVIGGIVRSTTSRSCNCKRSNCLKLYCDCFQGGVHCRVGVCNCLGCQNLASHEDERLIQQLFTLGKNPNAFRSKQSWMASMEAGDMTNILSLSNGTTTTVASLKNHLSLSPKTRKETMVDPVAGIRNGGNATMPMESATMAGRDGCYCKKSNCLKKVRCFCVHLYDVVITFTR
jgi:hypothetical protein